MPRVVVVMPAFNEEKFIGKSLGSIISQSVRPYLVIVCDNGSTDNTPSIARKVLSKSGIDYSIVNVRRHPEFGKFNINVVYHRCALESLREVSDFVATIEADTILKHDYFEKVIRALNNDEGLGIASGRIIAFSGYEIVVDSFPLPGSYVGLPGSARVYRYGCWRELNTKFGMLRLPAWDTDHVALAVALGWRVAKIHDAIAYTRPDRPFRGFYRGVVDAMHGLPYWWATYKAFTKRDPNYLIGYLKCRLTNCGNHVPPILKALYGESAKNVFLKILSLPPKMLFRLNNA
ncbi:glycosyl transferase, family 2 [Vulcanisaeta moutnovskia 768-28]|uniref:Glycosyl transferase, family 2 n=1 Tax=Vulcanisaeta moutnovskia (strain 768-28) TaxID=985053 RepID=F0QXW1_VULM7|nr:glycosyltransferase family 2 protein [Vulcanisaeta moutnovskia]ADY01274.1 glycosyl transferase, family 2 [Vulcanisaeta moutnovskia 768-28]